MDAAEARETAEHQHSLLNLKCEMVEFDLSQLVDLINDVDRRQLAASETTISIRFFDDQWLEFVGTTVEVNESRKGGWPRVWNGTAESGKSSALLVAQSDTKVLAYLTRADVVYELFTSKWSEHPILCKRDPDFQSIEID
ncbi:MAG: hypothetical protein AAGI27_03775 [Pseudomonadota bacterium]